MDLIICGGAFIVLWLYFRDMIENHDNQNTDGDDSADYPFPMSKPKSDERVNDTFKK